MDCQCMETVSQALIANTQERLFHGAYPETQPPDRRSAGSLCDLVHSIFFPGFFDGEVCDAANLQTLTRKNLLDLVRLLSSQIRRAMRFSRLRQGEAIPDNLHASVQENLCSFLQGLPAVAALVAGDVEAAFENDPAAPSKDEIVASYPGVATIAVQRVAHILYGLQVPLVPRMMTEVAHARTGIDIHPGARIGERFTIDHGTGVVIGETCCIGASCTMYHGVTLGAFNPLARDKSTGDLMRGQANKRHPDLEDHVTVYPGATILGGDTRIGHHSVIGGNVWLTHSVEPHSRVTIKDPELMVRTRPPG